MESLTSGSDSINTATSLAAHEKRTKTLLYVSLVSF
jgi:hypothetical protein